MPWWVVQTATCETAMRCPAMCGLPPSTAGSTTMWPVSTLCMRFAPSMFRRHQYKPCESLNGGGGSVEEHAQLVHAAEDDARLGGHRRGAWIEAQRLQGAPQRVESDARPPPRGRRAHADVGT